MREHSGKHYQDQLHSVDGETYQSPLPQPSAGQIEKDWLTERW